MRVNTNDFKLPKKEEGHSKKHKGFAVLAVIAVLLIVGTSIAFAAADGPEDVVRKFKEAVHNNDVEALEEIVSPDDERMEIDRKYLAHFLELMHRDKGYREATMSLLHSQLALYQSDGNDFYGTDAFAWVDYYLKREEGVLFDSYSIGVRPYFLHIKTNKPGETVKVDGETVLTSEEGDAKMLGPLMPGEYEVEGTKKYSYALVRDAKKVKLFAREDGQAEVQVDLTGTYIRLQSGFKDTRVIVNGKPINKRVEEVSEFGPVSRDGSITLQGEGTFPWGTSRSDKIKVTENTLAVDLTPKPYADKKGKDRIVKTVNTFFKEWFTAKQKQDASLLTVAGHDLKRELVRDIETKKSLVASWGKEPFRGVVLGTRIDFDKLRFEYTDDHYVVQIPVELHSKHNDNIHERMEEEFDAKWLVLRYDEGGKRWLVHSEEILFGTSEYFQGKNTVKTEFK